jgi:OmpA-OmpF porin, OOP family
MTTKRAVLGALAACITLSASAASAATPEQYFFFEGNAVFHDERIPDHSVAWGGRFGFGNTLARSQNSDTGLEVGVFHNPIKTDGSSGDKQDGLMLDLVQHYRFGSVNPYMFAGLGLVGERVGPAAGIYPALEVGGGLVFDVSEAFAVRAGVSAMSVHNDELDEGTDAFVDWRLNVGLFWPMGGAVAAAAPAAPARPARAVDSDGDGLTDATDRCPAMPASTADGCPPAAPVARADADNDGVDDGEDACPGTLEGLKVDARGCAVQTEAQSVVLKGVTFLPGSVTLTEDAKRVLEPAAAALTGQQDLKVEIGGHTDAQGADAANQKLSQRRADAVRQYLVGKGVDAGRLTAKGYGEAQPIASNDTAEGRAENRRVEFKIVR